MNKENRKEELEYVLGMYKKVETILDTWDKEDLKNRIKNVESELKELTTNKEKAK